MTTIDPALFNPTSQGTTTKSKDDIDKEAFLKLLVAQLKYQDPMKPTEGAEFMAQTAQFTMVEKLQELSDQNAELLASQRTIAGSSLIGRTVSYPDSEGVDVSGVVDSVRLTVDGPVLRVGDTDVPLGWVRDVGPTAD